MEPVETEIAWRPRALGALLPRALPLLVFLVAFGVRLRGLAAKPFWLDEITTLVRSSLSMAGVITDSLSFHHLPTYFLLTSWIMRFGHTEFMLRLPSALFGAAACAVVFAIGRRLAGAKAGLAAGLLMALSPAQVQYGQEARSYTLVTCLIAVGLLGQLVLVSDLRRAGLPLRHADASRKAWAAYALGTWGALNVLSVAWFWWIAANLAALAVALRPGDAGKPFLRNWGRVQALIAAGCLPWFVAMYVLVDGQMSSGLDWVPPVTMHHVWSAVCSVYLMGISSLISFHLFPQPVPWIGAALVLLGLLGVVWLRPRRDLMMVLGACLLVLPVSMLLISLHGSIWMTRYLLWGAVPFFVLVGLGVCRLPRAWQMPSVALLAVLAFVNLQPYYHIETKPRWDLAAAELNAKMADGDLVLVDDLTAVKIMNLYLGRNSQAIYPAQWTIDVDQAASNLAAGARVWAVQGRVGQADPEDLSGFLERVSTLGPPSAWIRKGRDVTILRFDPPVPAQRCQVGACPRRDEFSAGRPPRRDA